MPQEVIEVTEREVEIIEVIERGPVGPTGPQPDINYEVVSSARTLEAADLIAADTSGGAFTLTLPANPSNGDAVDIFDFSETFDTNPLTIARNGQPIESLNEDLVANVEGAYFTLIYTGATRGWQVLPRYGTSGGGGESALTTQGDMLYRGVGINTRLPIGSAGQILKVNSGATAPEWGAAPATGVTSVGVSGSDGIEVDSGSPVTGSGTIALGVNAASLRSHINVADGANNYTHPNHSGEVTSSGDGATTIANDVVTNAKLANVATATIKGRATAGTGDPEDLTATQVRTILNVADGAEVNVQSNWTEADSGSDAFILNKPTLGGAAALNVGTTTGTVAAGDDARLSDSRPPTSHSSSHASAGSDPLFDQDLNTTDAPTFTSVSVAGNVGTLTMDDYGLLWEGVRRWDVDTSTFLTANSGTVLALPSSDISQPIRSHCAIEFAGDDAATNAATTRTNLGLGDSATADIGTGSTEVAAGDHGHGNINSSGQVGTTANLPLKTGTGGIVETGAFGTGAGEFAEGNDSRITGAIQSSTVDAKGDLLVGTADNTIARLPVGGTNGHVLTVDSAEASGMKWAAASGGGVTGAAASASDVLGVSGANITGVDAGAADRLVFWDDSASKLTYLEAGSGLSISGTTLTATASGGSKTYAVFSAEHNQPPSTAFATLDTRNSIAVLDFDDATDESAVFVSIIPEGASLGSGLKIRLHWMATTATSGNVVWDVSLERINTDLDSDSFDTIASGTAAANGTSGILTVTEITLTTIDSVTAGDGFRLKVTRDANNASDTMTGDAELVAVEVRSAA